MGFGAKVNLHVVDGHLADPVTTLAVFVAAARKRAHRITAHGRWPPTADAPTADALVGHSHLSPAGKAPAWRSATVQYGLSLSRQENFAPELWRELCGE